MVVYFTGTGNSRYCAQMIGKRLDEKVIDAYPFMKNGIAAELISETPWVFCAPTYCWRLPHIFEDFLRSARFEGSKEAYFIMTCGGDIGNAEKEVKKLCSEIGLDLKGVLQVVMPENYVAMFDVPDKKQCVPILRRARRTLVPAIEQIRNRESLASRKVSIADKIKTGPVNPIFYGLFVKAKKFYAADACISCGKCVEGCVLNNISLKDGKPVWGTSCTHCMACICACPTEAIEYGKASIGKPRYQCPNYSE